LNPHKNFIPPTTSLVSCVVFESNNTSEQRNFLHAFKLQFFSLEIFVVDTDVMFDIVVINVDDECVPPFKKPKKVVVDVTYKFWEIWAVKMPWLEPIFNEVGLVFVVKCLVCTRIERKGKKMVVKWDFIDKHAGKKKGCDGNWIMDLKCMHVKNEISYVQLFTTTIL
jgi:hypothetical protein